MNFWWFFKSVYGSTLFYACLERESGVKEWDTSLWNTAVNVFSLPLFRLFSLFLFLGFLKFLFLFGKISELNLHIEEALEVADAFIQTQWHRHPHHLMGCNCSKYSLYWNFVICENVGPFLFIGSHLFGHNSMKRILQ